MKHAHRAAFLPRVELLEDRCVPANFDIPWIDPRHLTLSFAPDGTTILDQGSSLTGFLNGRLGGDSAAWQREILRAFQTWAAAANINIAVTGDAGLAFGTAGALQDDPRFGDIRIGARSLSTEVLSLTTPPDPSMPGTWTGDVMLNASSTYIDSMASLYRVFLHEAANVLGLRDSVNPESVRYPFFNAEHATPLAEDYAALQALYGVRAPDEYEGSLGNNSWNRAARLHYPFLAAGGDGSAPLVAYADLTTAQDVDYYYFNTPWFYSGPVTVRLQTEGISLLVPQITVYNQYGQVRGTATADDPTGSVLSVHVNHVSWWETLYLKVEGATNDVFSIGSYALGISFDNRLSVSESVIQQVLAAPLESVHAWFVDYLLLEPMQSIINYDFGLNDNTWLAWSLDTLTGFANRTAYQTIGSLHNGSDKDFYKVMSPTSGSPVLTVNLWSLSDTLSQPQVRVYNTNGQLVNATVVAQQDGTSVLQVANAAPNSRYYVEVWHGSGGSGQKGNYGLSIRFGSATAAPRLFQSQQLNPTNVQDAGHFYVAQTQLFSFSLAAQGVGATGGAMVRYEIQDAAGQSVLTMDAAGGATASVPTLLLGPGIYCVSVSRVLGSNPAAVLNYQLTGQSLSDPIGPQLGDTSNQPLFLDGTNPPLFRYPGNIVSIDPFLLLFES